jgi:UDP-GlcNAc:undecaprenyl-phosphate GlcNAc-1-phosphate transferase
LGLVGAGCFAAVAIGHGQYLVASLALLVAGSLAGYLPYNYPRASVFLGDAGSHLVGYLMAVLAILPHFYSEKLQDPRPWAVLSPLLILAVPLIDTSSVFVSRTLAGKPFWVGDTNHLSHRLVRAGFSKPAAVALLWTLAALLGLLALL